MSEPVEQIIQAEAASEGLAHGVIHFLKGGRGTVKTRAAGTPGEERELLRHAVEAARAELNRPAEETPDKTAAMHQREIARLSDASFLTPIWEAIDGGEPAESAVRDGLDLLVEDRQVARDDVQAEDLADLRDRLLKHMPGGGLDRAALPVGAIVVAEELTPTRFLDLDWHCCRGALLFGGNARSHIAMLARARGVPLLINVGIGHEALTAGIEAVLDAETGRLILHPTPATVTAYRKRIDDRARERAESSAALTGPACTSDGTRIGVMLNVDDPAGLAGVDPAHCDGIGLARSEFLFQGSETPPDEERQYRAYRGLLHWAGGLPVTLRTFDLGGDKPMAGLYPDDPGGSTGALRGLALSLARPEAFKLQLRTLARAAYHGPLRVMVPMVRRPAELKRARALLRAEVEALVAEGAKAVPPPFGMMVETPEAVQAIADFEADFLSLGTNDLERQAGGGGEEALLALIEGVCAHGARRGIEVGLCGEMAARPGTVPALLAAGVRVLSVPPGALAAVKAAVRACDLSGHG